MLRDVPCPNPRQPSHHTLHARGEDRRPCPGVTRSNRSGRPGACRQAAQRGRWARVFTDMSRQDRAACLHGRHPRPATSTRATKPALTGLTSSVTITPIHSGWVIPCSHDGEGSPLNAWRWSAVVLHHSCRDMPHGAGPLSPEAATPHMHRSLSKRGLSRRFPVSIDRSCSTFETVRLRAGSLARDVSHAPWSGAHLPDPHR